MTALRVVRIPYLNSVPFYQGIGGPDVELADLAPRKLGTAAEAGAADAGIMSMCDAFRNTAFESLGALGISCDGPSHSVLLFSRVEPNALGGATIAVTTETSTSYPLLRLLMEQRLEVRPKAFVRRPHGAQPGDAAELLIGDAALAAAWRRGLEPGRLDYSSGLLRMPRVGPEQSWKWALDLGAAWKEWQGLPFVFARWMVRRDVDPAARDRLLTRLVASLEGSMRDLERLAAQHASSAGLSAAAAFAYLMGFNYRLGEPELRGIERFRALLAGRPWWEETQPRVVRESGT